MRSKKFVITMAALANLGIYLFVAAPPALTDDHSTSTRVPIERVFEILDRENQVARKLYTHEIVGAGKSVGLKYDEHWHDVDVPAGPLPAQFLRLTAAALERSPEHIGLYLGSDAPINPANLFTGAQGEQFKTLRVSRRPVSFFVPDTSRYAYMSPDVASAPACYQCHNAHPESPKTDWVSNDVMGATTWTYQTATVSNEEMWRMITQLRASIATAYSTYLEKTKAFPMPPAIGEHWPREGYSIPNVDVFMAEVAMRASAGTVERIAALMGGTGPQGVH